MKKELFNKFVAELLLVFRLTREELFRKDKDNNIVDARQMLYYLCDQKSINYLQIEKMMAENGYMIKYNSIVHGIKSMERKMAKDADYRKIIKRLEQF